MNLSALGHEVTVVDNYLGETSLEIRCLSLYPLPNLIERCRIRQETGGAEIKANR